MFLTSSESQNKVHVFCRFRQRRANIARPVRCVDKLSCWLVNVRNGRQTSLQPLDADMSARWTVGPWRGVQRVILILMVVRNSPDNLAHNAPSEQASHAQLHNAYLERTPKMPGEPPRVQPSRKNPLNWDDA